MDIMHMLEKSRALLKGHFLLSSGLHSDTYIQCAKLLQNTSYAQDVGKALAEMLEKFRVDCVVSPALGGIVIGYEVARNLGVDFLFTERNEKGKMGFRRGFDPSHFSRIAVVEDVVTTGKSTKEVLKSLQVFDTKAVVTSAIISRQKRESIDDLPFVALETIVVKSYEPQECPLCKIGIELVKPGSRRISKKG